MNTSSIRFAAALVIVAGAGLSAALPAAAVTGEQAHRQYLQGDTRERGDQAAAVAPASAGVSGSYARYLMSLGTPRSLALVQAREAGERAGTVVRDVSQAPAPTGQAAYAHYLSGD